MDERTDDESVVRVVLNGRQVDLLVEDAVGPPRRRRTADDVLARLAVYYLSSDPPRTGILRRELPATFRVAAIDDVRLEPGSTTDAVPGESRPRRYELKLAAVGGNAEVLRGRRADAAWLDVTDPEHPLVEVHEIKTALGDLQAELRQPEKSAAWMQRAHRFWLTVPDAALVQGVDVPDTWGVLALPSGALPCVVRAAPLLTPTIPFPRGPLPAYVARYAVGKYTVASRVPRST